MLYDKDTVVHCAKIRFIPADNWSSNRGGLKALFAFEPRTPITGEAVNGNEAIELIGKDQPDPILTDIHMPVMD